ncbi:MAG TPA: hypothetical protein PKA05_20960 [Roseiflexaceae bacterium]|nr:hypothetical protein [Roseiflexaceae bacterium]HMP42860.1 hypothetical protein [Roseiflexaceae bacterium]
MSDYLQMVQARLDRQEHDRAARAQYLLEQQADRRSLRDRLLALVRPWQRTPQPATPVCEAATAQLKAS